jgi:elongation factor Ts
MAEISAAAVMKLRKMSGQGMMDCKKALGEANGDLDEAMALLRKKGLATMAKRAGRDTSEGRIVCKMSDDKKTAVMVSLCCETDFVSKGDEFIATVDTMLEYCDVCGADSGIDAVLDTEVGGKKFSEVVTDLVSKIGEKTEVGDYARYKVEGTGVIGTYIHFNHKIGALVEIETSGDDVSAAIASIANEIAMHVTAVNPAGLDRDSIDPAVIEKEREIARDQMKGKPENIIDKIVEGKMGKFFKDNCVVAQPFVKDDSKSVEEALNAAAKAGGGDAKIKRFIRFEIA